MHRESVNQIYRRYDFICLGINISKGNDILRDFCEKKSLLLKRIPNALERIEVMKILMKIFKTSADTF